MAEAELEFANEEKKQGLRRHHQATSAEHGPNHHRSYHLRHHDGVVPRQRGSIATARNARWEKDTDPRHAASLKWIAARQDQQSKVQKQPQPRRPHSQEQSHIATEEPESGDIELGMHSLKKAPHTSDRGSRRLSVRANPFSARSGKKLTWRNVNMELVKGNSRGCGCSPKNVAQSDDNNKFILQQCWGEVPEKEVTAIIGPSGSGKTSLLNVLAGRAKSRGNLKISADVRLNNYQVDPSKQSVRKQIAFVPQDDSLQITSTPREAIRFSAKMRLSSKTTDEELDDLTLIMLEELGLTDCADTIVGGALVKGISGGERKRTSVGVELVVKPALVFLDEPTSGLDAFSAVQLIQVLKKVASAGSSVLTTIHQPSSEVFSSFDHLIVMCKGQVMYEGEVPDVPDYFEARGHPVPPRYNPADWVMNVCQQISAKELAKAGYFPTDERQLAHTAAFRAEEDKGRDELGLTYHNGNTSSEEGRIGFFTQVAMLLKRELQSMARNRKPLVARYAFTTIMSTLVGVLFRGIGSEGDTDFVTFQAHFGALVLVLMLSMFGTAMPSLLSFPEERPVFLREYSTNHYSVGAYFASRLTTEALVTFPQMLLSLTITYFLIELLMPFSYMLAVLYMLAMTSTAVAVLLGCSVEDPKMATEFLPILFVPQLLFAGFFIATDLIPEWLRWAQYLCSLTYALRLALLAEFGPCANEDMSPRPNHCQVVLENSGADEDQKWMYWTVLCSLFLVFRLSALLILRKKAQKFF